MNEKVKSYIEKAERDKDLREKYQRDELLISLGLYDTVYSETPQKDFRYDRKTKKYYKWVPIEVSDEEYAKILDLNPDVVEPPKPSFWIVGTRICAWAAFITILIVGSLYSYRIMASGDVLLGINVMIGIIIGAFVIVSVIMIFIEMAQNVADIEQLIIYKTFKDN